ncbi:unnamed protein product [Rotaria sp. Silwood2]|nr:unnamed protein product [Rotaria sp. Silwood2]CAF4089018.1 unnamed protein product [Rotaria sp. Silwood2]
MIRQLKCGNGSTENLPIQDKDGKILINSKDVPARWKENLSDLLNVYANIDPIIIQNVTEPFIPSNGQFRQDKAPSLIEVEEAMNKMKSGKARGNDGISTDLRKAGGKSMAKWLHEIIVEIWGNEQMVEDWTTAMLIRIYKSKDDRKICDNYKGTSLLTAASQGFSRIILNRIQNLVDIQLLEHQAGFYKNRSTTDQIFILKLIMEKTQEFNRPLHLCFIDNQKAYDSANRNLLWRICRHYGISDKLIRMLKLLYKNTKARVRINGELSDSFNI